MPNAEPTAPQTGPGGPPLTDHHHLHSGVPTRAGPRPHTCRELPHTQLDQQPDARLRAVLARRLSDLPGVEQRASTSAPGARALCVPPGQVTGGPEPFLVGREFAHLHARPDSSLHLTLPEPLAFEAVAAGWAEFHAEAGPDQPSSVAVMVYAPRDEDELEIVLGLVLSSYRYAAPD